MKYLFVLLILLPATVLAQQRCCFQNLTPFSALSIQANTLTDTRIDVRWDDVQADSYVVTRNGTPVSGSPFSASITSISETGLTVNTQYIYKVTAYKNGYLASFNSDTTNTLSFSPSFMALFSGAIASNKTVPPLTYSNAFGNTLGPNKWTVVKSIVGNNQISYPDTGNGYPQMLRRDVQQLLLNGSGLSLTPPQGNYSPPYSFNSTITLAGDFTILWSERAPIGPSGQHLFGNGTDEVGYSYVNARFVIGGNTYAVAWPGGNHDTGAAILTLGIRRAGAFVYAYDGTTWSSGLACPTSTFTINQQNMVVDVPGYFHGFCIVPSALTNTQAAEFFNIWSRKNYISAADNNSPTVTNVNFSTTLASGGTGNYLSYAWMAYGPFGGGYKTINQVGQGKYTFFSCQALDNNTYKLGNRIFVRDHNTNKLSDPIDLGYYTYDYDSVSTQWDQFGHYTPSLLTYDNRLHILQYFPHYDVGSIEQVETRRTAPDFNFISVKSWSPWKGQSNSIAHFLAYPRLIRYQDKIIKVSAYFNNNFTFHQPSMEISNDNMNTWDFNEIFNLYTTNADVGVYLWAYPYLIHNGGTNSKIIIILNFINPVSTVPYIGWAVCYADASSPYVIHNWNNTFSKDISNRNSITWAEIKAHYIFTLAGDGLQSLMYGAAWSSGTTYALNDIASTGTGVSLKFWRSKQNANLNNSPAENAFWTQINYSAIVNSCYMDPTGEIFGLSQNYVSGDGYLSMFYGSPGSAMTFKPAFNFSIFDNGAYRVQLAKEGSNYSVYGVDRATPSQIRQWTTADKGSTWTSVGMITDGTHSHDTPMISENHAFTGNVNLTAAWSSGGTLGTTPWQLWIK